MGWANDRFRAELEAAGVCGAGLTPIDDYSEYSFMGNYRYCLFIDGIFRGSDDNWNSIQSTRSTLNRYFPGHDIQIVILPAKEELHYAAYKFEHWIAVVRDVEGKIHIYRKYIATDLELERFQSILSLKGQILALERKDDVDDQEFTGRHWKEDFDYLAKGVLT